jgi:FMN phosphatase YigB (HAD superfamily)
LESDAAAPARRLQAYALKYKAALTAEYSKQPDCGYWPDDLRGREEELWTPLLLNARIAGAEIEAEALEVARLYSSRKQAVQEQDREIAMARDLLDVLKALGKRDFSPGEIRLRLSAVDSWGSKIGMECEVLCIRRTT